MSQSLEERISGSVISGKLPEGGHLTLHCAVSGEAEDGCRSLFSLMVRGTQTAMENRRSPLCHDVSAGTMIDEDSCLQVALSRCRLKLHEISCDVSPGLEAIGVMAAADVLVLVVNVQRGISSALRKMALVAAVTGVSHVILLVNKMDLVDFQAPCFQKVRTAFLNYVYRLERVAVSVIPVSTWRGDNLLQRSASMSWYDGPILSDCLEGIAQGVSLGEAERVFRAEGKSTVSGQFEAALLWVHEKPCLQGRFFGLQVGGFNCEAGITNIKYRIAPDSLVHEAVRQLQNRDIAVCNLALEDGFDRSLSVGQRFSLTDRSTGERLAVGVIHHGLRRAQNVHLQSVSIGRLQREQLNGHTGRVIWFTGLSGAGKSTLANALEVELHARGLHTYLLDGDNVRLGLNRDLGFSDADRVENIRRIAEVAKLMIDAGLVVMTAFISPFLRDREMARDLIGSDRFIEIHVSTPLDVCRERDVKGLYQKATLGQIPNMTGINSPYEVPQAPNLRINTQKIPLNQAVQGLLNLLVSEGLLNDTR